MFERVGFDPGNRLTQQGDQADAAHLIIDGHAEVILETPSGPVIVATVGTNEIVGEVGFWATRRAGRRSMPKIVLSHCASQRTRLCASCGNSRSLRSRLGRTKGNCSEY
jgi:hypothetical protein